MSRLILIVVIIALVYWLLTAPRRQQRKQEQEQQQQPAKNAQDMVSCAQCGLNLPKSEGVFVDGKYFCSTAHSLAQKGK